MIEGDTVRFLLKIDDFFGGFSGFLSMKIFYFWKFLLWASKEIESGKGSDVQFHDFLKDCH